MSVYQTTYNLSEDRYDVRVNGVHLGYIKKDEYHQTIPHDCEQYPVTVNILGHTHVIRAFADQDLGELVVRLAIKKMTQVIASVIDPL